MPSAQCLISTLLSLTLFCLFGFVLIKPSPKLAIQHYQLEGSNYEVLVRKLALMANEEVKMNLTMLLIFCHMS